MFNLNKFKKPKATPKLPPRKIIPAKKKKPNTIVPPKTIPVVPSPHIADQHPQDNSINPALNDTQKTYINNCTTPGVNKPPITTTAPNNHESEIDNSEEPSTIERIDGEHTSTPTTTTPELTTITTTLRPTTTTPELTTIATTTPELTTTTTTPEPSTTREATQTITNPPVFDSIEATLNYTYFTDHNKYRVKHGVEPLQYNVSLEAQAQEYSKELASMKKLQHSHYPHQGENIGMASTSIATNIVSNMYDEIKMYDFDNPGFSLETGHFTQLIWKHSKNMGTGITCEDNVCWVCFRYLPSGNILGKFDVNVLRADAWRRWFECWEDEENGWFLFNLLLFIFVFKFMDEHNFFRKKHNVGALISNKKLEFMAQKHADRMAKTGRLEHSYPRKYGENIGMGPPAYIKHLVKVMYREHLRYNFKKPSFDKSTGHFTQIIWKSTRRLGTGITCKKNYCYVVFQYDPPGNVYTKFAANVKELPKMKKPANKKKPGNKKPVKAKKSTRIGLKKPAKTRLAANAKKPVKSNKPAPKG
uniref:SCP domain-containing protein n=1 Tax=Rhabditophanes sp. KR3021 TaxID=114890 RepID=A0AC35TVW9_9BILA